MLSTVNAQELPWNRLGIAGDSGAELVVRGVETPVPVDLDESRTCGSAEPATKSRRVGLQGFGYSAEFNGLKDSESPSLPSSFPYPSCSSCSALHSPCLILRCAGKQCQSSYTPRIRLPPRKG